jgi:hypothetical protein
LDDREQTDDDPEPLCKACKRLRPVVIVEWVHEDTVDNGD